MLSNNFRHVALLGLITLVAGLGGCSADAAFDDEDGAVDTTEQAVLASSPLILQDTPAHHQAYEELSKGWIRWAMEQPWSTGPVTDQTGAACALGQSGSTWFLAGSPGGPVTRDCTIPANTSLYFPLINLWTMPPAEQVSDPKDLERFIHNIDNFFKQLSRKTCNLALRLDGNDLLPDEAALERELAVEILTPFSLNLNADNFTGGPGGFRPAVLSSGYYALFSPLSPGEHTLELGGARCHGDSPNTTFETAATYHLHVQ